MIRSKAGIGLIILVLTGLLCFSGQAQTALKVTPYQSFIKSANTVLSVSSTPVAAVTATAVICPATHAAGCTIRVRVSTQLTITGYNYQHFFMNVTISGTGKLWPNSLVDFGSFVIDDGVLAHSFEWMKTGVPAGTTQTISIKFQTDGGAGQAGYRLASIDLLLN